MVMSCKSDIMFEKFKWLDTMLFPSNILIFYFNLIHSDCCIDFLGYQVLCCKECNYSQRFGGTYKHVLWKAGNINTKSTLTEETRAPGLGKPMSKRLILLRPADSHIGLSA